jgi:pimeloyl-ACP methyl ester carboxylesterase
MSSTFLHLAGDGEPVYFSHANGFPAGVYEPFLTILNQKFEVFAVQNRATQVNAGQPDHNNWDIFANDLIQQIETQGKPVIAIGHSLGASCTVLAAIKRPDLFKALILIEPAMLSFSMSLLFKFAPKKVIRDSKLVQGTLNKPDTWNTRDEYLTYIKKFKGYKKFSEQSYEDFADHAIRKEGEAFTLAFPKTWEAHNYTMAPYLMNNFNRLDKLNVPTIAIRGASNMFFSDKLWEKWQAKQPKAIFLEDKNFAHLIPLEGPRECMALVNAGLKALNIA